MVCREGYRKFQGCAFSNNSSALLSTFNNHVPPFFQTIEEEKEIWNSASRTISGNTYYNPLLSLNHLVNDIFSKYLIVSSFCCLLVNNHLLFSLSFISRLLPISIEFHLSLSCLRPRYSSERMWEGCLLGLVLMQVAMIGGKPQNIRQAGRPLGSISGSSKYETKLSYNGSVRLLWKP